ncbi:ANTAR domain-containing protein [Terrabacter sp. BE26]|uniref:ANTAR domain-containing protein n=1 Tax=Terrabacter sp. BE26 TaxID=2898152 RepID=UPI0035BE2EC3
MHDQSIRRAQLTKGPLAGTGAWPAGLEGVAAALEGLLTASAGLGGRLRHLSLVHLHLDEAEPLVTTSALALAMTRGQLRTRCGPVYEAVETGMPVIVASGERPSRFPPAAASAAEQEPASELAVPVRSRGRPAGALSVYWTELADVDLPVLTMAEALAAQAGDLIDHRRQVMNLQAAMRSRELIGQACGVLMSRYRLTEEQAMHALRLVSQERNVKLREVSAEVAESGTLVELD